MEKLAIQRRKQKPFNLRNLAKYKYYFVGFFALLILTLTSVVIYQKTSLITIRNINVTNTDSQELKYISGNDISNTLLPYVTQKFFAVNSLKVSNEIKKKHPYAKRVFVNKQFPRSINVKIEERIPYFIVNSQEVCTVVDDETFVVEKGPAVEGSCAAYSTKYSVPVVKISDLVADLKLNSKANLVLLEDLNKTTQIVNSFGFTIIQIEVAEDVVVIKVNKDRTITLLLNTELDIQLKRFVLVMEELQRSGAEFKTLDVRYERPVMYK